jgi:4-amino-4-deoxy-L-arabinose transferase-like glycosyltransferase
MEARSSVLISRRYSRRWPALALGAVVLALTIGLAYVKWVQPLALDEVTEVSLRHYPGISGHGLWADEFQYLSIAKCISSGGGYGLAPGEPTAIRVPGYPLFVASLFLIFGSSHTVALLGNAFLIALLPALTFVLSKSAFGCKSAAIAAFFCALDPGLYYNVLNEANSEALFAVLLCAATVTLQRAVLPSPYGWRADRKVENISTTQPRTLSETRSIILFALAGVLFGAASLTRTGFLGLPLFIVLMVLVVRKRSLSFKKVMVFCLAFVITLCPWALRNRAAMGKLMFSSTNDGVTLLGSVLAAKQRRGDWINPEFVAPQYAQVRQIQNPVERDRTETRLAIAELKKISPIILVEVAAKRVLRLWVPLNRIVNDHVGIKANVAVNFFDFPVMLLAAFGLYRARHNPATAPLWATCLYLTLLAAVSWGGTRFRYGAEPFLAVFAAHGLLEVHKFSFTRLRGKSSVGGK